MQESTCDLKKQLCSMAVDDRLDDSGLEGKPDSISSTYYRSVEEEMLPRTGHDYHQQCTKS